MTMELDERKNTDKLPSESPAAVENDAPPPAPALGGHSGSLRSHALAIQAGRAVVGALPHGRAALVDSEAAGDEVVTERNDMSERELPTADGDVVVRYCVEKEWLAGSGNWDPVAESPDREQAVRLLEKAVASLAPAWHDQAFRIRREEVQSRTVAMVRAVKSRALCRLCNGAHKQGACRDFDPWEDRLKC